MIYLFSILLAANSLALILYLLLSLVLKKSYHSRLAFIKTNNLICGLLTIPVLALCSLLFFPWLLSSSERINLILFIFLPQLFPLLQLIPKNRTNTILTILSTSSVLTFTSHFYLSIILTLGWREYTPEVWRYEHLPNYYYYILICIPVSILINLLVNSLKRTPSIIPE